MFLLLVFAMPILADESETDANLMTALDVSDSIICHEEWLEFYGLAKAATSAVFLDAIASGTHGIGPRKQVAAYFDQQVRGGPGPFVMEVSAPGHVAAAMLDKLLRDLIAARSQARLAACATKKGRPQPPLMVAA